VASLTKVMSSVTLSLEGADLDEELCVDKSIAPGWQGAGTRLKEGDCTTGWDLMGASLVSSDNGAAFAYPLVAGQLHSDFVSSMNDVAQKLGMSQSEFQDPAGIYDENISTARDITKAAIIGAFDPNVSIPASSKEWVATYNETEHRYRSTNKAKSRAEFLLAKTGYTDTARAGFTGVYQKDGRRIAFTVFGAWYPSRRDADVAKLMDWVSRH